MYDSMNGCNVLPDTWFVGTRICVDLTRFALVGGSLPIMELPERIQSLTTNCLYGLHYSLFLPQRYFLKYSSQDDSLARQRGIGFPLLGELPKAIEPQLPICQLYRWQLGAFVCDHLFKRHRGYRALGEHHSR